MSPRQISPEGRNSDSERGESELAAKYADLTEIPFSEVLKQSPEIARAWAQVQARRAKEAAEAAAVDAFSDTDETSPPDANPFVVVSEPDQPKWVYRERAEISEEAEKAARELDGVAARRRATPVRKAFVRAEPGEPNPPLSKLVSVGGRGGGVAIRLYLALLWRCSSPPYNTDKPARAWATLLDLEDPPGKGARRITAALKTLAKLNLIEITREPTRNLITLLDESGNGNEYVPPSTAYYLANRNGGAEAARPHRYLKLSSLWWIEGGLQTLSTPALAMLLILIAEQNSNTKTFEAGGIGRRLFFSTGKFAEWYRISAKTRSAGTKELEEKRLLIVRREALPDVPGSTFTRRRYRNIYQLINPPGDEDPEPDQAVTPGTITN